ncbi:MAG TPA: DUF2147 domain-containing protein [Bacteroidales bacterium]|nr:DUF2147 domain-containing protein [Bacteroidales bacterium]
MKSLPLFQLISIFLFANQPLSGQNQIVGRWLSPQRDAIVEIYELAGKFYGKITWMENTANTNHPVDSQNPDIKLRKRPLIGLIVVSNLVYRNNEWVKGSLYYPPTGRTYPCKLELSNSNTLEITTYSGPFHTSWIWTRF